METEYERRVSVDIWESGEITVGLSQRLNSGNQPAVDPATHRGPPQPRVRTVPSVASITTKYELLNDRGGTRLAKSSIVARVEAGADRGDVHLAIASVVEVLAPEPRDHGPIGELMHLLSSDRPVCASTGRVESPLFADVWPARVEELRASPELGPLAAETDCGVSAAGDRAKPKAVSATASATATVARPTRIRVRVKPTAASPRSGAGSSLP